MIPKDWTEESYRTFTNYLKSISLEKTREFNKKIIRTK